MIVIEIGEWHFAGRLEATAAPQSVAWLSARLPLEGTALQARWSGEAAWMPIEQEVALDYENLLRYPQPGQVLLYAGNKSEPELLLPYGSCAFASRAGDLAGNHVITLEGDFSRLRAMGRALLYNGAQPIRLRSAANAQRK